MIIFVFEIKSLRSWASLSPRQSSEGFSCQLHLCAHAWFLAIAKLILNDVMCISSFVVESISSHSFAFAKRLLPFSLADKRDSGDSDTFIRAKFFFRDLFVVS